MGKYLFVTRALPFFFQFHSFCSGGLCATALATQKRPAQILLFWTNCTACPCPVCLPYRSPRQCRHGTESVYGVVSYRSDQRRSCCSGPVAPRVRVLCVYHIGRLANVGTGQRVWYCFLISLPRTKRCFLFATSTHNQNASASRMKQTQEMSA